MNEESFQYKRVIVRPPCSRFAEGLTHGKLGKPDVRLAVWQHEQYVNAIRRCGVEVIVLPPDNDSPKTRSWLPTKSQ